MNKRIDYKFKELVLRLLLILVSLRIREDNSVLISETKELIRECEAISDGRMSP